MPKPPRRTRSKGRPPVATDPPFLSSAEAEKSEIRDQRYPCTPLYPHSPSMSSAQSSKHHFPYWSIPQPTNCNFAFFAYLSHSGERRTLQTNLRSNIVPPFLGLLIVMNSFHCMRPLFYTNSEHQPLMCTCECGPRAIARRQVQPSNGLPDDPGSLMEERVQTCPRGSFGEFELYLKK